MSNAEQAKKYLDDRDYKMKVFKDDGLYRHLRFKNGDSMNGYFDVTTWPGYLCFSGDMGCFVFSRIEDMVEFFADGETPGYWSEKVQAESIFGDGVKEFTHEAFQEEMESFKERLLSGVEDEDRIEEINYEFRDVCDVGDEHEAIEFIRGLPFDLADVSLPDEFTFHYLFACHALHFACNKYLESKK